MVLGLRVLPGLQADLPVCRAGLRLYGWYLFGLAVELLPRPTGGPWHQAKPAWTPVSAGSWHQAEPVATDGACRVLPGEPGVAASSKAGRDAAARWGGGSTVVRVSRRKLEKHLYYVYMHPIS